MESPMKEIIEAIDIANKRKTEILSELIET